MFDFANRKAGLCAPIRLSTINSRDVHTVFVQIIFHVTTFRIYQKSDNSLTATVAVRYLLCG